MKTTITTPKTLPMRKLQVMIITLLLVLLCGTGSSAALKGLVQNDAGICYYYKGTPIKDQWKTVDGKRYYFNKKGNAVKGAQKIGNKYYLFTKQCVLFKPAKDRFYTQDGNTYYVKTSGEILADWFKKGKYVYYGNPVSKGAIVKGKKVQGVNFDKDGHALKNTTVGKVKYKAFEIVGKITKPGQSKKVLIQNCWTYVTKTCGFRYYSPYNPKNVGTRGFQFTQALQTLETNRGTCTGITCAFAALVDACGFQPKIVRGKDIHGDGSIDKHTWIEIDGLTYDPYKAWKGRSGQYALPKYPTKHEIIARYDFRKFVK